MDSLEQRAREVLPEAVHRYFRQGARLGVTASEAVAAWDHFRLRPRVLRDVTQVSTATNLLGSQVRSPIAVAPTTLHRAAHPEGEVAMARGAAAAGALMVLSSNAGATFEEVASTGVTWWLQAYVSADRLRSRSLLERAVSAGARAVVLTVDTPVVGTKYDDGDTVWDLVDPSWLRVNLDSGGDDPAGDAKALDLGPQDVDWLVKTTGLPVVVKGVLRADDARRCVDAGASAVWVSNHGGRQLDYAVSAAEALGEVAAAVGAEAEVYVDGGVRSGLHVLMGLALGAGAVFLGRLPLYALAVGGAEGVCELLESLTDELAESMRLSGSPAVDSLAGDLVTRVRS